MTFGIRISQQQDMLDLSYRTQVKYLRREIIHGARERQISRRQIRMLYFDLIVIILFSE